MRSFQFCDYFFLVLSPRKDAIKIADTGLVIALIVCFACCVTDLHQGMGNFMNEAGQRRVLYAFLVRLYVYEGAYFYRVRVLCVEVLGIGMF